MPPTDVSSSFEALKGAFWVMLLASMTCVTSRWFTVGCTGCGAADIVVRTLEWEASLPEPLVFVMMLTSSESAELKRISNKMFFLSNVSSAIEYLSLKWYYL